MPPQGYELFRRVQQAAEGTPYVVEETDQGFDVTLNIVDAQWYGLFNKAGLKRVFIHHVAFPADDAYAVTDDARSLEWVAGTPRVGGSMERQIGRVKEFGAQKVYAFDEHGDFGKQVDYRFNSEEGRRLITGKAEQLGLQEVRGGAEKIGLFFAVLGIGGALVTLVVLLICWQAGVFG
jgi:hypothetical protein